jgi:hypothetical protein
MALDDFPLIPATDATSSDEDLDAAEASALEALEQPTLEEDPSIPFGRTPLFDFATGRMVRAGDDVVWVSGLRAVEQWCLMAIYSARFAHSVFTEEFGMEEPERGLGHAVGIEEEVSDWGQRLEDALLVHDRIVAVEDFEGTYLADQGVLFIRRFTVVTDEDDRIPFRDIAVALNNEED